jgi:hypothetical protein
MSATMIEHALHYANMGWHVFPVPPGTKKSHKSAARSDGRPWGKTIDPEEIRRDFEQWPDANIGIATGEESDILVLDADTMAGHGVDGLASITELESKHGKLPDTARVKSPTGSIHWFFKWPGFKVKNIAGLVPGVDVRSDGGMVIGVPSVKPGVGTYEWLNSLPIADAPQWLLDLIKAHKEPERVAIRKPYEGETSSSAGRAMKARYDEVASAPEGTRNDALNKASYMLGQYIGAGELSDEQATAIMLAACESNGSLEDDGKEQCVATIKSGMKGGIKNSAKTAADMFKGVDSGGAGMPTIPDAPSIVPELPSLVPPTAPNLILSSGQFVAGFVAPSFLIDGVIQQHNVYALTAAPGTGKTAIALRLAAHVALGRKLGDRDVERGRVLYFAAENYVDVQARLIAMAEHCGFDVNTIDIYFVPGTAKLSEIADRIALEAQALGDLALVIVDTSAATFEGSDENSNVDGLVHAKRMRSLTELRGKPTVLVLCHPVKSATNDNLLPRGGSSFFGEIDGNLCARKTDSAVEMHWFGKIRGMDFAPIAFRLDTVVARGLKDAKGRNMPTVLATPIDDAGKQVLAATERSDQDRVLRAISERPGESSNEIAKHLRWAMRDGAPYGMRVRRAAERMAGDGLLMKHRGAWILSARGEKELNNLDRKIAVPSGTSAVPALPPFPPRIAH